jgi:amino acid adenylation domain-containing protein
LARHEPVERKADRSFSGLLRCRAAGVDDGAAYVFLAGGETETERLSWRELDAGACKVAAALSETCKPGERALLLFPPGLDFVSAFCGCLYARVVAVPAYPPRPRRDDERLRAIARDAAPAVVLTTSPLLAGAAQLIERAPELAEASWLAADTLQEAPSWDGPEARPDDLAFLQYTSGSTASPKGVMVSHANLAHNERMIQTAFGQDEESVVAGWLPLYHDMGLIGNVLQPLWSGGRCVLMSPASFLQRPRRWLEAIGRYRATTSGGPNFAYDLCVRRVAPAERPGLDLSSWRVAFNGAEPVRAETLGRFAAAFAPCGFRRAAFYPCYGLAEATLLVAGGTIGEGPRLAAFSPQSLERNEPKAPAEGAAERRLVGCGRPWLDQRLAIVDPESLAACPAGAVGEIWVAGPSVAQGYWGQPEETERTFGAVTAPGGEPWLRTGDLGFLAGEELYVTGRLKDLIILRGRNHYPQDLELTAERSHPALRPGGGAAFALEVGSEERLVLVHELERRAEDGEDLEQIAAAVRRSIAGEHEVPVHEVVLVRAGAVPKTSSGKVQRRFCGTLYREGKLAVLGRSLLGELDEGPPAAPPPTAATGLRRTLLASRDEERLPLVEELLRHAFARLTRTDGGCIDPDRPLVELGLDSLVAVELTGAVEAELEAAPSVAALLDGLSLREAARQVLTLVTSGGEPVLQPVPGAEVGEHPLSWGQRSLWFLHRLAPESAAYNMAAAVRLCGSVDRQALLRAFQALVDRHAVLRTTYGEGPDGPVQRVAERGAAFFQRVNAADWSGEDLRGRLGEEAFRPFDLERGPVLRVTLFARGPGEDVLLFCVHHIAADLWSLAILVRELGTLYSRHAAGQDEYEEEALPRLDLHYADYARWQVDMLAGSAGRRLWEHWQSRLAGAPVLALPADRPRPLVQSYQGASRTFRLGPELSSSLRALARSRGCTLFMVLLTGYQALLSRLCGQEDFLVGCPTSGRAPGRLGERLTRLVGYFVNPVALRADLAGEPAAGELLERVRRTALDAFEHQDFPLAVLAERLGSGRDAARAPLIQALLVQQKSPFPEVEALAAFSLADQGARLTVGGLTIESVTFDDPTSQFELSLSAGEIGNEIAAMLRWSTDLFDTATIDRIIGHLANLLRGMAAAPRRAVADLDLLSEAERRELEAWNRTAVERPEGPRGLCLHQLCEAQVERTPDAVAVVAETEQVSYGELNRRANRLARALRRCGVGPEERVGVLLERSPALVSALLAVLKAGGAYVPLDPAYPAERLAFTAKDAGVAVLLSDTRLAAAVPLPGRRRLLLDAERHALARESGEDLEPLAGPRNLAYVLYTSGSTGRPKGVAVEHRSAAELLHWARCVFPAEDRAGVLASTSICFDLSVFELFLPLAWGGAVVMAENLLALPGLSAAGRVTLVNTVPSAMAEIIEIIEIAASAAPAAGVASLPPGLRTVCLAGEALAPGLAARIHRHPQVRRVLNLYGPSEDTTYSTWDEVEPGAEKVTIGRPLHNTRAHVLDARLRPVPVGVAGELCLAGAGLARGYLGRPELTAERFVPELSGGTGARLYRTGDLARRLADGRIDFLGRLDHQVKVRGFRIELGEIEAALAAHPEVREAAVVARDDLAEGRALVAYLTPRQEGGQRRETDPDAAELRAFLRARLPDPMVPARFVVLSALPRIASGKLDRKALPRPQGGIAATGFVPPRTPAERAVAEIWAELLGRDRVGIHDNLFDLGGHSLLAIRFTYRLQRAFGAVLPLREIFRNPTVSGIAERLAAPGPGAPPPLERVPRGQPLPLSYAQERLWFLAQLEPASPAYHIPAAVRLAGALSVGALAGALAVLLRRHEALRTTFPLIDARPAQVIAAPAPWSLPVLDLEGLAATGRRAELRRLLAEQARRPFDLERGPLLRAVLLRTGTAEHVLCLTLHHIAADGWSLGVLAREVSALYGAAAAGRPASLAEPPLQYADFAVWQRRWLAAGEMERQLGYWRECLAEAPAVLELPADRPRPAVQTFRGARRSLRLGRDVRDALVLTAHRLGATLFMAFLAAVAVLLARHAGQPDVVLGIPIANRRRPEVEDLIGFFANTLALRTRVSGELEFRGLLGSVREAALAAYAHQDLPFDKLVEELGLDRSPGRPPLVQVLVAQWEEPLAGLTLPGVALAALALETRTAKFDLTLRCADEQEGLGLQAEYGTDLFDGTTIERLLAALARLLAAASDPGRRLDELLAAAGPPDGERQQLLVEWNDTALPESAPACLHDLFALQAARTPEVLAVQAGGERLTYRELDERSNRLARYLGQRGVGPESRVGVRLPRSADAVVAILAVLKAGGALVPLDLGAPRQRLESILREAGVDVVLTHQGLRQALPAGRFTAVELDAAAAEIAALPGSAPAAGAIAGNLAYVLFTSGSTGQPKGVMVEHRSVAHLLTALRASVYRGCAAPLRVALNAPLVFDASVKQWVQLLAGHTLVVVPEEVRTDAVRMIAFLRESAVQVLDCTPSQLSQLVAAGLLAGTGALERVLIGGEDVPRALWSALAGHAPPAFFNVYGPTECTVDAAVARLGSGSVRPVLGRPIANVRIDLLDAALRAVPLGVAGELCIGGAGVSRGYLGRPAETAERFVPDPWARAPGDRLYRSGDLARCLPDGTLEMLGRIDRQVKLRGFRIELGEIEAVLGEHPRLREAAVLARAGRPGNAAGELRLVAYVSCRGGPEPRADELRSFLAQRLPGYMLPSTFVLLPDLPRTRNGKIDRSALPAPELFRQGREPAPPRSPVEEVLAGMMAEVLGVDDLGVDDNFFERGGNSLRITELVVMIRDAFGVELPLFHVFDRPTVAGLAAALLEDPEQRRQVEDTAPILLGLAAPEVGLAPEGRG